MRWEGIRTPSQGIDSFGTGTHSTMETKPRKIAILARNKLNEYKRVLKISDKPDREEFSMSAKVTGAGIVIIGGIGMLFYLVSNLLPGAV